jgi:serine/threonine-protein kinase
MAPEQVAGDDVSAGWDLWALGVITYEMVTGAHPFRPGIPLCLPPTSDTDATITGEPGVQPSPEIATFFRQALSPNRADRPATAADFLALVEQVLA